MEKALSQAEEIRNAVNELAQAEEKATLEAWASVCRGF